MTDAYEWDGDWSAIASMSERLSLEEELQRKLCLNHILYGVEGAAVGRRWRRDDVLFLLSDGRIAQVHLTRPPETDPNFPDTQINASFEDWNSVP
jgi:hypothetical protein